MILVLIAVNSLLIIGFHASIQKGQLLQFFTHVLSGLPPSLRKPLGTCPTCMASIYGSSFYWLAIWLNWVQIEHSLVMWPFYVLAVAGLNKIIIELIYDTNA